MSTELPCTDEKPCLTKYGKLLKHERKISEDCNTCQCRNGNLECTRVDCTKNEGMCTVIVQFNINLVSISGINVGIVKKLKSAKNKVVDDPCDRCEDKKGEEVCGGNGKTYNSLCHAVNCAGLKAKDVTAGSCEKKVGICVDQYIAVYILHCRILVQKIIVGNTSSALPRLKDLA